MKQLWKRMQREDGAAQMIEAAIIYPVVFLCVFVLIYIGLFILQTITVSTYAQKAAMLTAREISYPGYLAMIGDNTSVYSDGSAEGNEQLFQSIVLNTDPKKVEANTYRYWNPNLMDRETLAEYEDLVKEMVVKNSIITSKDKEEITVKIDPINYFIVQYVNVTVTQPLVGFPVLEFFGIETPTVSASAQTSVSDTDEFIRNVDFVMEALETLANKLGINVADMKKKINEVKEQFKLN